MKMESRVNRIKKQCKQTQNTRNSIILKIKVLWCNLLRIERDVNFINHLLKGM